MSKIFKAANVTIDRSNKFFIEVDDYAAEPIVSNPTLRKDNQIPKIEHEESEKEFDEDTILEKVNSKADEIIKKAEQDSAKILEDAKSECEKLRLEILETSRAEGYEEGYSKGVSEAEQIKVDAQKLYTKAENDCKEMKENIEPQMIELVLKATSKLLNDTTQINPNVIANLIKQGLAETTITGDINIRVSSDDFEAALESKDEILSLVSGGTNIEIIKDASLKKLDCIIETSFGDIDCGLDQKYDALKNSIYYILENR